MNYIAVSMEEFPLHVLFVCTGNICRSPTAERLAAAYGAERQIENFHASSAGIRAVVGHPLHPAAIPVLVGLGGDPSNFAARQLTPSIASAADLIVTMTQAHRDAVLTLAPHRLHRTFTLTEAAQLITACGARSVADLAALRSKLAARDLSDIPDPIGLSQEFFADVGSQIAELLLPLMVVCTNA